MKLFLLTHNMLGKALIDTTEIIAGKYDITFISNENKSLEQIKKELIDNLDKKDINILLTDIKGGSCFMAALYISKEFSNVVHITGVNLPLIIHILHKFKQFEEKTTKEIKQILSETIEKSCIEIL